MRDARVKKNSHVTIKLVVVLHFSKLQFFKSTKEKESMQDLGYVRKKKDSMKNAITQ